MSYTYDQYWRSSLYKGAEAGKISFIDLSVVFIYYCQGK